MLEQFTYHMPTKIHFAEDALQKVGQFINGRRVAIITSPGAVKRGIIQQVRCLIDNISIVNADIKSHPEFKDLEALYAKIHKHKFDVILAIGGGSVLDAAKYFSIFSNHDNRSEKFVTELIKGRHTQKDYTLIP